MSETIIQGGVSVFGLVVSGYDTLDDLRSQPTADSPLWTKRSLAITFGSAAALDGDFGFYAWDPTSVAVDDGANVIKPTAILGEGRWRLIGSTGGGTGGVCFEGDNICFDGDCPNQALSLKNEDTGLFNRIDAIGVDGSVTYSLEDGAVCGAPVLSSFNCVEDACVDPGDGSGTYPTLEECLAECFVPAFGCCQNEGGYYPPAYSTTSDRIGADHQGTASSYALADVQLIQPECVGASELAGIRPSSSVVWDPVRNKFFVGLQGGGPGGTDIFAQFDPLTFTGIDYGTIVDASGVKRLEGGIYVSSTQRIWFKMASFATAGAFVVINPLDMSYVIMSDVLVNGVTNDFVYVPSVDMIYCTTGTGTKLVKIDPATFIVTAVSTAFLGLGITTTSAIEYVSSTQMVWFGWRDTIGIQQYGFAILDPSTDLPVTVFPRGFGSPSHQVVAITHSDAFDRVLVQELATTFFLTYANDSTDQELIPDITLESGAKGVDVASVGKFCVAVIEGGQRCLRYFTAAELNPP